MKIGIISDIHAQYDSLEKALTIFEREGVDEIFCAGDLVEKGTDGNKVIQTIIQRKISCVRGNHDEAAVTNQRWFRKNLDSKGVNNILEALNRGETIETPLLSDKAIVFLQNLPFKREFLIQGIKILMVHGSPLSNSQYLMPAMPDSMFRKILRDVDADIVICGHTHSPMLRKVGDMLLLNPGSVCNSPNNRESHTCAILSLPDKNFNVFFTDTGEAYPLA